MKVYLKQMWECWNTLDKIVAVVSTIGIIIMILFVEPFSIL